MAQLPNYLRRARAHLTEGDSGAESVSPDTAQAIDRGEPDEEQVVHRSERSEESEKSPSLQALALVRWRATLSRGLLHWDDGELLAMVQWSLALAFERGGLNQFRRYLPSSLAALSDTDLHALVDWELQVQLERHLWRDDSVRAGQVSRGGQVLATWWNRHQARLQAEDRNDAAQEKLTDVTQERLRGLE